MIELSFEARLFIATCSTNYAKIKGGHVTCQPELTSHMITLELRNLNISMPHKRS